MANVQALEQLKRNTAALESVRDVRAFIDLDRGVVPAHTIKLEVPGQALPGYHEYKVMLTEEFNALLPGLNQQIKARLVQREKYAKDQITKASERL